MLLRDIIIFIKPISRFYMPVVKWDIYADCFIG
jgi:hypothetical protein